MNRPNSQPRLLVFTLGARADSARRRLLPARWRGHEVDLRRACFEAAVAAGREAGCRVDACSPRPLPLPPGVGRVEQIGDSFGERLRRAFDGAIAEGEGPVVVVGADAPGLRPIHVERALAAIADDPRCVVLGPSRDGGFYLLAAARPLGPILGGVPWCRRRTLAVLRRRLASAGRPVVLLAPLSDLDRPADLETWLAGRADPLAGWLARLRPLHRLLAALRRPAEADPPSAAAADPVTATGLRGPPPFTAVYP